MINSVNSLRFIFSLMIFHHHFFLYPQIKQFGLFPVSFFFILSGYVMSIGYADKVNSNSFLYKKYIIKRMIRIFPLNLFSLFLCLLLPIINDIINNEIVYSKYKYLILDIFLVQSWIPVKRVYFSGNSVSWFLSDIFFCYLLFPFIFKYLRSKYSMLFFLFFIILYFIIIQFIEGDYMHSFIYINPLFRILDFSIGIMLFKFIMILPKHGVCFNSIVELLVILFVIQVIVICPYISLRYSYSSLFWIPSLMLIFVFANPLSHCSGVLFKLLNFSIINKLGTLSFPFYMLHVTIIKWYRIIEKKCFLIDYEILGAFACIIITMFISYIYINKIVPHIENNKNNIYV